MFADMLPRLAQSRFLPWPLRKAAIARRMRADSLISLDARVAAIDQVRYAPKSAVGHGVIGPVWQFWDQAPHLAPPIVRNCLQSVERNLDGRERILLNMKSFSNHVDLPGKIMDRLDVWGWTKFSNLLRLKLLETHGGTWVDATVCFARPIPQEIAGSEFFVFQWDHDPRILATWFMHSRSRYPLIAAISAVYENYWLHAKAHGDYFMFHHLFEALIAADANLADYWRRVPIQSAAPPHELQNMLHLPYDRHAMRNVFDRSWIQKLTYKADESVASDESSFFAHLSRKDFGGL